MRLNDRTYVRSWQYTAVNQLGQRGEPMTINENLTGAVLGNQRPARITFRTALWLIHGWNQLNLLSYRLIIPNHPQ